MAEVACGLPDTSQRGFGSRQVLHVRDPALGLRSFSLDTSGIYLARTVPGITTASGVSAPYDRSLLDLTTGVELPIAVGVMYAQFLPTAQGQGDGRSLVMTHFESDAVIPANLDGTPFLTLTFLDEVTGAVLDIPNVDINGFTFGATRSDPILVGSPGSGTTPTPGPLVGPPENLVTFPSPVNQIVGRDHLGFIGLTDSPGGKTQAFTRFPFDITVAPMEVEPGVVTLRSFVTGDDGSTPNMTAASLSTADVAPGLVCPDASASNPAPSCLLFFDRLFTDGSSGGFVRFLDDTREFQLPEALSSHLLDALHLSPTRQDLFWTIPLTGAQTRIYGWHLGDPQAASCIVAADGRKSDFSQTVWQPGTGQFASIVQTPMQSMSNPGAWNLVEGTAGAPCHVVASGANLINQAVYSPDGTKLALLENDPNDSSTIYVAPSDGSAPTVSLAGQYFFYIEYHDPTHLLLWHTNTDGYSVSWLDVSTTPATEHPITDRARWDMRTSWAWLTPQWVLLADSDLTQDGSYSLHVLNIDTGEKMLVSQGVIDFRVSWNTPPVGATELAVTYTVRSRTASSQDGIWTARIALDQFQP
jgi:hypothetical protein